MPDWAQDAEDLWVAEVERLKLPGADGAPAPEDDWTLREVVFSDPDLRTAFDHVDQAAEELRAVTITSFAQVIDDPGVATAVEGVALALVAAATERATARLSNAHAAIEQGQRLSLSILEELEKAAQRCYIAGLVLIARELVRIPLPAISRKRSQWM